MKQFAVLGLGQFGRTIAIMLAEDGHDVLAIDSSEEVVDEIKDKVAHAVRADLTDEDAMRRLGLEDVEAAVIAVGEEQLVTILATAVLRKIGVTRIIARSASETETRILRLIGANEVISPETEVARQVAQRLTSPGYFEVLELATGEKLVEIGVKPDWIGRTIGDIDFRARLGVNIVAIKRGVPGLTETGESVMNESVNCLPSATNRLEERDVLLVIGSAERIEKLREEK
jgi:trk system potassium uptake protein TrkA